MLPSTTHVAPATVASVSTQPMADIIDSLKRLERIGSENSKTVEKIISAAADIANKIVEQYAADGDVTIDAAEILRRRIGKGLQSEEKLKAAAAEIDYSGPIGWSTHPNKYSIEDGQLFVRDMPVSQGRQAALLFAGDLSNGLLAIIAEDLRQRQVKNEEALKVLGDAKTALLHLKK